MKPPELIVALDVADERGAWEVTECLAGVVDFYKVGLELFTGVGPRLVRELRSKGFRVFLDLKLHDIPNTVAGAARAATRAGANLLTLHALGGTDMMRAAAEAAAEEAERTGRGAPDLVGVTILTSQRGGLLVGPSDVGSAVGVLASAAREAGLAGVVASAEECAAIKRSCGRDFLVVTPGIRPSGASANDQRRVATPARAVAAGSDFLVVGRPILRAQDPRDAASAILDEIRTAVA